MNAQELISKVAEKTETRSDGLGNTNRVRITMTKGNWDKLASYEIADSADDSLKKSAEGRFKEMRKDMKDKGFLG